MIVRLALALLLTLLATSTEAAYTVTHTATSITTAGDPSYVCNLPASIAAGDLLIVAFVADQNFGLSNWPAGWTELSDNDATLSLSTAWRFAVGGETTVTVTRATGTADQAGCHAFRIQGAHASQAPEISASASGTSEFPDPSSVTATWGAEANLFLAIAGLNGAASVDTYPSGYSNGQYTSIESGQAGVATARKEASAATDDPPTFDLSTATNSWFTRTIVIRPAVVGGVRGRVRGGGIL